MQLAKEIGGRLRDARKIRKLSQQDVANKLGLTRSQYTHFENGRTLISLEYLVKIPHILDRPITYFLGLDSNRSLADLPPSIVTVVRAMETLSAEDRRLLERFANYLMHKQEKEASQD